jgi:hypothetical protein
MRKFAQRTGCGLELLALRRSYGGRRRGSIRDLAIAIYRYIESGGHDLAKAVNLTRAAREFRGLGIIEELERHRRACRDDLTATIDVRNAHAPALATGVVVSNGSRFLLT